MRILTEVALSGSADLTVGSGHRDRGLWENQDGQAVDPQGVFAQAAGRP
jgi:hypothetical protein